MPRKTSLDRAARVAAVAFEKSLGKTQQQISSTLKVSQSDVSRLLESAQAEGWLGTPPFNVMDRDAWARAKSYYYSTEGIRASLHKSAGRLGERMLRVSMVHSGRRGVVVDAAVIEVLKRVLARAKIVGITWGHTVSGIVDALHQQRSGFSGGNRYRKIVFVPLCGEPLAEGDPGSSSSSVLAQRLNDIVNNGKAATASIAGTAAFIPLRLGNLEDARTRDIVNLARGYARVFGPENGKGPAPLVRELDTILTSAGCVDKDRRGIFLKERILAGDISEDRLMRSIAGDIGGILIPKADIPQGDARLIADMNKNWTGAKLEHLLSCAKAAASGNHPGVVLFAFGAYRQTIVRRCVELGLVNELVIDKELADALAAHVE